jgi:hypothetical protein
MSRDYPTNSDDVIDIRSIISRVEELRDERKPKIVVGFNIPGYMPDSEPNIYFGWEDARSGLVQNLRDGADEFETDLDALEESETFFETRDRLRAQIADLRALADKIEADQKDEEFGATFGKYHYFMTDTGEQVIEDESDNEELQKLEEFLEQLQGYGGDHKWEGNWYPTTLVNDDYFTRFAEQEAEELGLVSDTASWPHSYIDWERAADALKSDYASADFDGQTFWYRSA